MTATLNAPTASRTQEVFERHNGYSDRAFDERRQQTVSDAVEILAPFANRPNGFDTIVTQGVSGNAIGPTLAYLLNVHYAVIRKPDDNDNHDAANRIVGYIGRRVLFVDDFTASGSTFYRVIQGIKSGVGEKRWPNIEFVGRYFYAKGGAALFDTMTEDQKQYDTVYSLWKDEEKKRRPKVNLKKSSERLNRARQRRLNTFNPPTVDAYWSASNSTPWTSRYSDPIQDLVDMMNELNVVDQEKVYRIEEKPIRQKRTYRVKY